MSVYDFSNEEEQREVNYGPVPAGSIVLIKLSIIAPTNGSAEPGSPLIKIGQSGLRMLNIKCEVTEGEYSGVSWYQHLTLPCKAQNISLNEKQATACRIGGATLKAILQAAKKPMSVPLSVFNGLVFPVKVKIRQEPYESQTGQIYWKNEIARVVTPDDDDYQMIREVRQIINPTGAVTGMEEEGKKRKYKPASPSPLDVDPSEQRFDEVPF